MNSRVFVVHEPTAPDGSRMVNLRPAAAHGDVTYILPAGRPPSDPEASLPAMRTALASFTPLDFIVLVGELDLVAAAAVLASRASGGPVSFLKWDRDARAYFPIRTNP